MPFPKAKTLTRKPGPESTRDDVREELISAGVERLLEVGLSTGLERLKLADVIGRVGASRATAYRSLEHDSLDPQTFLHRAVLERVVRRATRNDRHDSTSHAAAEEFDRQRQTLESTDIAERTRAMRSVIRYASTVNFNDVAASTERAVLTSLFGSIQSMPQDEAQFERQAQRDGEEAIATLFIDFYTTFSGLFGYQLKALYEPAHFATAVVSLVEGTAMRVSSSDHLDGILRPTGPGGAEEEWTLFGVAFEGVYTQFWEPKDADNPVADLIHY